MQHEQDARTAGTFSSARSPARAGRADARWTLAPFLSAPQQSWNNSRANDLGLLGGHPRAPFARLTEALILGLVVALTGALLVALTGALLVALAAVLLSRM